MRIPRGLDRQSFRIVEGWSYVESLIDDLLGTRRDTRVLRRSYCSDIPAFIDAPGNAPTVLRLCAEVAAAADQIRDLETGEPVVRFRMAQNVSADARGRFGLSFVFDYLVDGSEQIVDRRFYTGEAA